MLCIFLSKAIVASYLKQLHDHVEKGLHYMFAKRFGNGFRCRIHLQFEIGLLYIEANCINTKL